MSNLLDYILNNILVPDNNIQHDLHNKILELYNEKELFEIIINKLYNIDNQQSKYVWYIILSNYIKSIKLDFQIKQFEYLIILIKYSYESNNKLFIKGCNLVLSSFITKEGFINCEKLLVEVHFFSNKIEYLENILNLYLIILNDFKFNSENINNLDACLETDMIKKITFLNLQHLDNRNNINILIVCIKSVISLLELEYNNNEFTVNIICDKFIKLFSLNNLEINQEIVKSIYIFDMNNNKGGNYYKYFEIILKEVFKLMDFLEDENTIKDIIDIINNLMIEKKGWILIEQNLEKVINLWIKYIKLSDKDIEKDIEENWDISKNKNVINNMLKSNENEEDNFNDDLTLRNYSNMALELIITEFNETSLNIIYSKLKLLLSDNKLLYKELGIFLIGIIESNAPNSLKNEYNDIIANLNNLINNIKEFSMNYTFNNINWNLNEYLFSTICYSLYVIYKNLNDNENIIKLLKILLNEIFQENILIKNTIKIIVNKIISDSEIDIKNEVPFIFNIAYNNLNNQKYIDTSIVILDQLNSIENIEQYNIFEMNKKVVELFYNILIQNKDNVLQIYDNIIFYFKNLFKKNNKDYNEYAKLLFNLIIELSYNYLKKYENIENQITINYDDSYEIITKVRLNLDFLIILWNYDLDLNVENINKIINDFLLKFYSIDDLKYFSLKMLIKIFEKFNFINNEIIIFLINNLNFNKSQGIHEYNRTEINTLIIKLIYLIIKNNSNNLNKDCFNMYMLKNNDLLSDSKLKKETSFYSILNIIQLSINNIDIIGLFLSKYFKKFVVIIYINDNFFKDIINVDINILNYFFIIIFKIFDIVTYESIFTLDLAFVYKIYNRYHEVLDINLKNKFIEVDNYLKNKNIDSYNLLISKMNELKN